MTVARRCGAGGARGTDTSMRRGLFLIRLRRCESRGTPERSRFHASRRAWRDASNWRSRHGRCGDGQTLAVGKSRLRDDMCAERMYRAFWASRPNIRNIIGRCGGVCLSGFDRESGLPCHSSVRTCDEGIRIKNHAVCSRRPSGPREPRAPSKEAPRMTLAERVDRSGKSRRRRARRSRRENGRWKGGASRVTREKGRGVQDPGHRIVEDRHFGGTFDRWQ